MKRREKQKTLGTRQSASMQRSTQMGIAGPAACMFENNRIAITIDFRSVGKISGYSSPLEYVWNVGREKKREEKVCL